MCVIEGDSEPLSSPNSNFDISRQEKLQNFHVKLESCGCNFQSFVAKESSDIVEFPVYCNNRACSNEGCIEHRHYLFKRNHEFQLQEMRSRIFKPKGWVFTGWRIPVHKLTRVFCQEKLSYLVKLLGVFSTTAFSVHMELKIKPPDSRYRNWTFYLHFHVVCGSINRLGVVRQRWGRQVKYESAIKEDALAFYVSKYASKTPYFDSPALRDSYHLLVYKTQMHRFSLSKKDCSLVDRNSDFYSYDLLVYEARACLYRDSYLNPKSKEKEFHPLLESGVGPPLDFDGLVDFDSRNGSINRDSLKFFKSNKVRPVSESDLDEFYGVGDYS